jgi:hypothetical protein
MSFRPTTSSRVLGRYFSTHIKDSSGRLVWGVAIRIPQVNVHCILGGYRFNFSVHDQLNFKGVCVDRYGLRIIIEKKPKMSISCRLSSSLDFRKKRTCSVLCVNYDYYPILLPSTTASF